MLGLGHSRAAFSPFYMYHQQHRVLPLIVPFPPAKPTKQTPVFPASALEMALNPSSVICADQQPPFCLGLISYLAGPASGSVAQLPASLLQF